MTGERADKDYKSKKEYCTLSDRILTAMKSGRGCHILSKDWKRKKDLGWEGTGVRRAPSSLLPPLEVKKEKKRKGRRGPLY